MKSKKVPQEIEVFAEKALPVLKEYGYLKPKINLVWMIVVIITTLTLCGTALYLGESGAFKPIVNQNTSQIVDVEPQIDNTYDFKPTTTNNNEYKNNFTIENNIYIDDFICDSPE